MAFRKVDVDPFNDEDEKWIDSTASMSLASGASDSEIRSALARGDASSALKLALPSSPMLVECLLAVRPLDIPNVVKGLSAEECDGVIKAVYGGWKAGRVDNGLLAWFEKVVEVSGLGGITRTLTDRS